jgi:hypothetical protein
VDIITASPNMTKDRKRKLIAWATVLWVLCAAILLGTWYVSKELSPPMINWTWMIEEKCPNKRIAK